MKPPITLRSAGRSLACARRREHMKIDDRSPRTRDVIAYSTTSRPRSSCTKENSPRPNH